MHVYIRIRGVAGTLRSCLRLDGAAPRSLSADIQFQYQTHKPMNVDAVSSRPGQNGVSGTRVNRVTKSET